VGSKLKYSTSYHLQTDGQTEVTSQTLGTLLRALIKLQSKAWDLLLLHAEFAYNKAPSKVIGLSPLKVVYGLYPLGPVDLVPRPLDKNQVLMLSRESQRSKRYLNKFELELRSPICPIKFKATSIGS